MRYVKFHSAEGKTFDAAVSGESENETLDLFVFNKVQSDSLGTPGVVYQPNVGRGEGPVGWTPK